MNGQPAAVSRSSSFRGILWGGVLAGLGDLLFAFVYYGMRGATPVRILQSIASGLLGARSYEGGAGTAVLGFVLHFVIAFGAATVYYLASRKLPFLLQQAAVCGLLYGIVVYAFMNAVVLPLSALPRKPTYPLAVLIPSVLGHMVLVGLPIALSIRRAERAAPIS